jgi:hypothetical protein
MPKKDTYNTIVCTQEPRGRFKEGIIDGTPYPGTIMQIKAGVEEVGGRFTYEAYNQAADGDRPQGAIYILLEDALQGKTIDDAYVSGTRGFLYAPLPGDELLARLGDVSGTGDAHTIGEKMMVDDGTGELIVTTGTPETEPFCCLETLAAPTADTHVFCEFTGF